MRRSVVAVLSACALILTACTEIPRFGPVTAVDFEQIDDTVDVDFLPPGPSVGASQEEILLGFIAAGTAAQNNYRVARSYLAAEISNEWNPNQVVLIRAGEGQVELVEDDTLQYSVPVLASVDESGRYDQAQAIGFQDLVFGFVQENGEWRISDAPPGIVLTEAAFREAFASFRLYYFSADYREVVPDIRWFATRGDVLSKIVRGLIDAPTFWLDQGATVTAFPPGLRLVLPPVVVNGQALVDVTSVMLETDEVQRQRVLQQLTLSLQQVPGVASVEISVNQIPLAIDFPTEEQVSLSLGRDARAMVVRGREFGYVQGGRIERIEGVSDQVGALRPTQVFFSPTGQEAAVVTDQGLWRVGGNLVPSEPLDVREGLIRPIIDGCGMLWSATTALGPEALLVFPAIGEPDDVAVDLPGDSTLITMELARDNTRLVFVVQTEAGVRVLLAAIERDDECFPQRLGDFVELAQLTGRAVDAAWVDEQDIAVVTRQGSVGEAVLVDVSGRIQPLGRPSEPVTLVGGVGGVSALRLLTDQGVIFQPRGNGWQATGDRADVLVTQK
jgi:NACalpha-BTF3-like transcription factor